MNVTTVKNLGMGDYRLEGEGFTAVATLHHSWSKSKKTRVYVPRSMEEAAVAELAAKGKTEPVWPTRPESVNSMWDKTPEAETYRAAHDAATDLFVAFRRAVRRIVKPRLAAAVQAMGLGLIRLDWNAKAGCGCGCSPAFVAQEALLVTVETTNGQGIPTRSTFAIESLFLN